METSKPIIEIIRPFSTEDIVSKADGVALSYFPCAKIDYTYDNEYPQDMQEIQIIDNNNNLIYTEQYNASYSSIYLERNFASLQTNTNYRIRLRVRSIWGDSNDYTWSNYSDYAWFRIIDAVRLVPVFDRLDIIVTSETFEFNIELQQFDPTDSLAYYRVVLYDHDGCVVDDSGNLPPFNGTTKHRFYNLKNNRYYRLNLYGETVNGYIIHDNGFYVSERRLYTKFTSPPAPAARPLELTNIPFDGAVSIRANLYSIKGHSTNSNIIFYNSSTVDLSNNTIYWDYDKVVGDYSIIIDYRFIENSLPKQLFSIDGASSKLTVAQWYISNYSIDDPIDGLPRKEWYLRLNVYPKDSRLESGVIRMSYVVNSKNIIISPYSKLLRMTINKRDDLFDIDWGVIS